jgi:epoxyqueuosine reductase
MSERGALRVSLEEALDAVGLRFRMVGAEFAGEMTRSLVELRDRGIAPEEILSEYERSFAFATPEGMAEVRSLVVAAAPSPPVKVVFALSDREVEAVIPPTYVSSKTRVHTLEIMREILGPAGYAVQRVALPAKLLAVRVGLAEYGRNGLAYVEGMGSFARLDVYGTDADLIGEEERCAGFQSRLSVPPRMRKCLACAWCHHACPTQCISSTGDRIDPLRCLTYLNEHDVDWPEWLDPRSHNSLVGCMVCQMGCRANVEGGYILPQVPAASFNREETEIILENLPEDQLPESLREKLESLDLAEYSTVLGRNLRVLADLSL